MKGISERNIVIVCAFICALCVPSNSAHNGQIHKKTAKIQVHSISHDEPLLKNSKVPNARPAPTKRLYKSEAVEQLMLDTGNIIKDDTLRQIFYNCLPSTLDTTVLFHQNKTESKNGMPYTFLVTGDIPAMWLRDSTFQISPYINLAKIDPKLRQLALGVINTQAEMINTYVYGNAFFPLKHWNSSISMHPSQDSGGDNVHPAYDWKAVFEAKYELDSVASFLYLSKNYYESTGDYSFTQNPQWVEAVKKVVETMKSQQRGTVNVLGNEPYTFMRRTTTQSETTNLYGRGNPVKRCGLVRSFFRPSDDSTIFQYNIPANALSVVGLEGIANLLQTAKIQPELLDDIIVLAAEIREGIFYHGVVQHPEFGEVYAYEVDCYGSTLFMDDANIPSLLSMPKFGFVKNDDPTYISTRKYVLSPQWNPYYATGKFPGIGSPHTGLQITWHLSLVVQAMTSNDEREILRILDYLKRSTAKTGLMHESFYVDNPNQFTRSQFAWANSAFGELVLFLADEYPHLLAEEKPKTEPKHEKHAQPKKTDHEEDDFIAD